MSDLTDLQLIEGYEESGEIRHFDDLVRRHIGTVRSMIYPMVMNDADADEITQEVFLRVMKGFSNFKRKAKFSSWLYMITMNTTRNFLRSRKRNPVSHHEEIPDMPDKGVDPSAALMNKEFSSDVDAALAELSPVLRSAIMLVGIQGMSTSEAAEIDGCLTATMYWRVHQARKLLSKRLRVEG